MKKKEHEGFRFQRFLSLNLHSLEEFYHHQLGLHTTDENGGGDSISSHLPWCMNVYEKNIMIYSLHISKLFRYFRI